ncbi:UDP-glucose 4-epimerase [Photobacterium piscicola]|uniref:UDP-glucose 4-epimerase n=1 Tax=Photobacterium piscicola TaxID=1378299 RepID=A0A1T5I1U2_9GAMM|nr:NAD-dependent epimerase/dehydratase family protein [Photobacterium piscicola]SKC33054.1 UDP-glucose 4-epimerase [Photobacterium piscicola]
MKILILGGTGVMGKYLAQLLVDDGNSVYVTSRKRYDYKTKIKFIFGDARETRFLKEILQGEWDAIVDFMSYSTAEFQERLDLLLNSTEQYIYLSSARVYANSKDLITEKSARLLDVTQDSEYLSTDEYALTKARQEDLLFNSTKKNWTIIRPYITYGEERLQLGVLEKESWLYRALKGRPIAFSNDIYNKTTTLTYGSDVARGIASIIRQDTALGEAFHITCEKSIMWKDVLGVYVDVLDTHMGKETKVVLQDIENFLKWNQGFYQIQYDRLYDRKFDNSKIGQYIDTSTFSEPASTLKACLQRFITSPNFFSLNWKNEAIKDRQLNVRTPLKELPGIKQRIKYFVFNRLRIK